MPIELISTFRKKINIHFFIVMVLAMIAIGVFLFVSIDDQRIRVIKNTLIFFLILYTSILYERRKNLFRIFSRKEDEIISSFEAYLEERKQKSHRLTIMRMIVIGILTVGIVFDLFIFPENNWNGSFIPLWLTVVLLLMAEYWLNMNTHIMLQDLKHLDKEAHSEISE